MFDERKAPEGDTKNRIMDAAERLYVDSGADGMSLRSVTRLAGVNTAAVNYHFGSKERLVRAVLERRLDPLNEERLRLLSACEARFPGSTITCEHVLAALFVPAVRQARRAGEQAFLRIRFLGRAYSDSSPLTVALMKERYDESATRFLDAFARALPTLSRADLKLRLSFVLKAVSGLVASTDLRELLSNAGGEGESDRRVVRLDGLSFDLLASLGGLMAGALTAPPRADERSRAFAEVFALSQAQRETDGETTRHGHEKLGDEKLGHNKVEATAAE